MKIFMCLYLKEHKATARGIISEVEDWGFKVSIPSFDFKGVSGFSLRSSESRKFSICACGRSRKMWRAERCCALSGRVRKK
jgi:exoribonuclease R